MPKRKAIFTRSSGRNGSPMMEDATLVLPKPTELPGQIGQLWNCRTSTAPGLNIFDENAIEQEKYLEVVPVYDMQYSLSRGGNSNSKSELLDISVEVVIELPGLGSIEGGVSFKKEDTKRFNQDEFFCQYNLQTCVLRLRPLIQRDFQNISNKDVVEEVQKGQIATHYVSEIRYGGYATGRFRISDKFSHDLLDLSGSVGGSIPIIPGINARVKASIGFMEENKKENFSSEVNIISSPAVAETVPTSITEMFELVEKIPEKIKETPEPYPGIKGVAISITLTPISHLPIEIPDDAAKYNVLESMLLEQLTEMTLHLNDLGTNNWYRDLIRLADPRLLVIFPAEEEDSLLSRNPWAKDVDAVEEHLGKLAEKFATEASTTFRLYKEAQRTVDDLKSVLQRYSQSELHPARLKMQVDKHVAEGKSLLSVLRIKDAAVTGQKELFVFDSDQWEDKILSGIGIFLNTNGTPVPGVFHKLYSLTPLLTGLEIPGQGIVEVRVAAPNIVDEFSLALKFSLADAATIYKGEDILKVLSLLQTIVQPNTNSARFTSIYSYIMGISYPEKWNLSDFPRIFEILQAEFNEKGVVCCDNYLQTVDALLQTEGKGLRLLILPQFLSASYDAIFYWKELCRHIQGKVDYVTVVGMFDNLPVEEDGPLLLVLGKDKQVHAVCFDQLDFLLASDHMIKGDMSFAPLAPQTVGQYCMFPSKLNLAREILAMLSSNFKVKGNAFLVPENFVVAPTFVEASRVLRFSTFHPVKDLVGFVAIKAVAEGGTKFRAILEEGGWSSELGFSKEKEPDWDALLSDIQVARDEIEGPLLYVDALISALVYASNPEDLIKLSDPCKRYTEEFFMAAGQTGSPLHTDILLEIGKIGIEGDFRDSILKASRLLHMTKMNFSWYEWWKRVHSMWELHGLWNVAKFRATLETVGAFTEEEIEYVWRNPRFRYWAELFFTSKGTMALVYRLFWKEGSPAYFPTKVLQQLKALDKMIKEPTLKWPSTWKSVERMIQAFGVLLVKLVVPDNFMTVLLINLQDAEIKETLQERNALFHWDEAEGHFTQAWGLTEIRDAFYRLRGSDSKVLELTPKVIVQCRGGALFTQVGEAEMIQLNSKWARFTRTGYLERITDLNFLRLSNTENHDAPLFLWEKASLEEFCSEVISFIVPQLKLENPDVISPEEVMRLIDYRYLDPSGTPQIPQPRDEDEVSNWQTQLLQPVKSIILSSSMNCFGGEAANEDEEKEEEEVEAEFLISRSDLITLLLTAGGSLFQLSLVRLLCQEGAFAVPLMIPDITKEELLVKDLSDVLCEIDLKEYFPTLPQTRLLHPNYKMVVALSIGDESRSFGGSYLLNSILKRCRFSSRYEPGYGNGPFISRDGLVELTWLSKDSVNDDFYSNFLEQYYSEGRREMVLLAVVHGDALNLPRSLFEKLRVRVGAFLVFWYSTSWKEMIVQKEELKTILSKDIPQYNLVVDPDVTIRKQVPDELIVETWSYYMTVVEAMVKETLLGMRVTNGPDSVVQAEGLLELLHDHGVHNIRRSFHLQNRSSPILPELRAEALACFKQVITQPQILWQVQNGVELLSKKALKASSDKLLGLEALDTPDSELQKKQLIMSLAQAKEQASFNQLSLLHFARELELEYARSKSEEYFRNVSDAFLTHSFPVELLNLSFSPSFTTTALACLDLLQESKVPILTVSVLGPRKEKAALLNKLFGHSTNLVATDGLVMQLFHPVAEGPALLLLDFEGHGGLQSLLEPNPMLNERLVSTLLLGISDVCILTPDLKEGDLSGILETALLAYSSFLYGHSFPSLLVIQDENQVALLLSNILEKLRCLTSAYRLETRVHSRVVKVFEEIYATVLTQTGFISRSDSIKFFEGLRERIYEYLNELEESSALDWYNKANKIWHLLKCNEVTLKSHSTLDLKAELQTKNIMNMIKYQLETVFSVHEDLLANPDMSQELDFSELNGIPYFCSRIEEKVCRCEEVSKDLDSLDEQLINHNKLAILIDQIDNYSLQLRSTIIARMSQEYYGQQLKDGDAESKMAKKLVEFLELDPYPWAPFRQYLASYISFPSWMSQIEEEIEEVFGNEFLESVKSEQLPIYNEMHSFDTDHFTEWRNSPLDILYDQGRQLSWQEYVWLEMEVERTIRQVSGGGVGYKQGMCRKVVDTLEKSILQNGLKLRVPDDLELQSDFMLGVHKLGVNALLRYWQEEWERWMNEWDVLHLLDERKDLFPDQLFVDKEE